MWINFTEQGILICFSFLFTGGSVYPFEHIIFYALVWV